MFPSLAAYDFTNSQANRGSLVSCLAPHRTANTVSLANDTDHDLPYGIVIPRTHTPIVTSRINPSSPHVFTFVRLLFRTSLLALAVVGAGNMAL